MKAKAKKSISPDVDDKKLIDLILSGEKYLYETLIRSYNARLYKTGMAIVKDDEVVQELMQRTYIKAYEKLGTFEHRSAFGTWLTRIMINECLKESESHKRFDRIGDNESTDGSGRAPASLSDQQNPAKVVMNKELARMLENSLEELPLKYRLVFVMREMEEFSIAETMKILSISEANVKTRLSRAKAMLRDKLTGYYRNDKLFHFHLSRCDALVDAVFRELNINDK